MSATHLHTHLPISYFMGAFGSNDNQKVKQSLTLVGTILGTYLSFKYLPPTMNKWVGSTVLLSGVALLFFGSVGKVLELLVNIFTPAPSGPSFPSSYPGGSYGQSSHHPSWGVSGGYRAPRDYRHNSSRYEHKGTPYSPPRSTSSTPIDLGSGEFGSLHTSTQASGKRAHKKKSDTRPSPSLSGFGKGVPFTPSQLPTFSSTTTVDVGSGGFGSLHTGSRASGKRAHQK